MDLAKRLHPFGVRVMATKRSWASYAQEASKLSRSIFLPNFCGPLLEISLIYLSIS